MPRFTGDYSEDIELLEQRETTGLEGVDGSMSYELIEVERHFHSWGRWFELASVPNLPTHAADRVGTSAVAPNPFQIDAGNNSWGSWVQILGSSDTPVDAGKVYFDLHQIIIPSQERASDYFIQIAFGASGAAGFAAGDYEEFPHIGLATPNVAIINIQSRRIAVGTLAWARCICPGQNTGTLDFYPGIHEYEG